MRIVGEAAATAYKHPGKSLVIAAVVTGLAMTSAWRLSVDPDIANMLPRSFESVQNLERLKKRFGGIGFVTVRVQGANEKNLKRFAADIVPRLEALPNVRYVDYKLPVKFFRDRALYFTDIEDLKEIRRRLKKRVKWHRLRANPLYVDLEDTPKPKIELKDIERKYKKGGSKARTSGRGRLSRFRESEEYYIDVKASQMAILVKPTKLASDVDFARRVVADVQRVVDGMDKAKYGRYLRVYLHGRYRNRARQHAGIKSDLRIASSVAVLMMLLYLGLHFRRVAAVLLVLLPLFAGIGWTFGLAGIISPTLNLLTAFIAVILLGLGIDHGIHLLGRYQSARAAGAAGEEAVRESFRETGRAIIVAALTTSVAFIGVSFSEMRGFREFGRLAAAGTFLIVAAYTLCLPALLALIGRSGWRLPSGDHRAWQLLGRLAGRRVSLGVLALSAVALVLTAIRIPDARFNYNFADLNRRNGQKRSKPRPRARAKRKHRGYRHVHTRDLIGRSQTQLVVLTQSDEEALAAAKAIRRRRRKAGPKSGIDFVITSRDFVPRRQQEKHAVILGILGDLRESVDSDFTAKELKKIREIRNYVRLPPFTAKDLPIELRRRLTAPQRDGTQGALTSFALVFVRSNMHDGAAVRSLARELRAIPVGGGRKVSAAGEEMILADVLDLIFTETPQIMIWTAGLVFIAAWLLVGFRRGLLCLVPPTITVAATVGLMSLLGMRFNYLNVVMLPVLFGLAVDGGVHLVLAYDKSGWWDAGVASTGRAVAGALITTAFGFGALGLSGHSGLQSLAWLTLVGLGCAFVATLVVMPALLWTFRRRELSASTRVLGS